MLQSLLLALSPKFLVSMLIHNPTCVLSCAAALQQVVQNDPVNSRLEAVLAPALAPIFAYVARTPAFSNAITSVAGANSTLVRISLCACMTTYAFM